MPVKQPTNRCVRFAITCLLLWQTANFADSLPNAAHGTIALVPLPNTNESVKATFLDKAQLIQGDYAVVAVPLETEPGEYPVVFTFGNSVESKLINVLDKQYPEEHITIADEERVTPSQPNLDRITKESARMRAAYNLFTAQPTDLLPIVRPVEGRTSGVFGSRRFFNGKPRNPHSGIDWAAPSGTPIVSPAPGRVEVVGDFFFNGKTVLIDHGGGLISMMCHMSEVLVEEETSVARGQVIGKVGTTGRSTGPHLHWSVSMSGYRTDPVVFMAVMNSLWTED